MTRMIDMASSWQQSLHGRLGLMTTGTAALQAHVCSTSMHHMHRRRTGWPHMLISPSSWMHWCKGTLSSRRPGWGCYRSRLGVRLVPGRQTCRMEHHSFSWAPRDGHPACILSLAAAKQTECAACHCQAEPTVAPRSIKRTGALAPSRWAECSAAHYGKHHEYLVKQPLDSNWLTSAQHHRDR